MRDANLSEVFCFFFAKINGHLDEVAVGLFEANKLEISLNQTYQSRKIPIDLKILGDGSRYRHHLSDDVEREKLRIDYKRNISSSVIGRPHICHGM